MAHTIDTFERGLRSQVRSYARAHPLPVSFWRHMLVSAIAAPFVLVAAIFVPFVGQALAVILCALLCVYVFVKRSALVFGALVLGIGGGLALLGFFVTFFQKDAAAFYYAIMALSMFVTISSLVILAGRLWLHYERATVGLSRASRR